LDVWLLGVSLVSWAESFPWPWDLLLACDCVKCLVFKGLMACQSYSVELLKYIFKLLAFFVGNVPAMP
jgi:hypothetical protein